MPHGAGIESIDVAGPITTGRGKAVLIPDTLDLAAVGYQQAEYFVSGTANSFTADGPLAADGQWSVQPASQAPYTTRVIVRRPIDPAAFDGTVAVEWLNVSGGLDEGPDWTSAHVELIRSGTAWVGVSAQKVGIDGSGNALGAKLALKNADPERYAPLVHPGDNFSYDIYSQVGTAVRNQSSQLLGDLTPQRVLAIGESQSAFRLTTYVNAMASMNNVYDGYLIHSRAGGSAPLSVPPEADVATPSPTYIRSDLTVPVLQFETQSDVVSGQLGFVQARQDDTDRLRTWEVAGTAHEDLYGLGIGDGDTGSGETDTQYFATMQHPPSSIYGGVISCAAPINTGPQTYVLRSAFAALDRWVRTGEAPPSTTRLALDSAGTGYVVDDHGDAVGGIRTPHVDAPIATLSDGGQGNGTKNFCFLFGTTVPFSAAQLDAAYGGEATFLARWDAAVDSAVTAGAVMSADAGHLKQAAQASGVYS